MNKLNTRRTDSRLLSPNIEGRAGVIIDEILKLGHDTKLETEMENTSDQCTHTISLVPPSDDIKNKKEKRKILIRRGSRLNGEAQPSVSLPAHDMDTGPSLLQIMNMGGEKSGNVEEISSSESSEILDVESAKKKLIEKAFGTSFLKKKTDGEKVSSNKAQNAFKPSKEDFEEAKKKAEDFLKTQVKSGKSKMTVEDFLSEDSDDFGFRPSNTNLVRKGGKNELPNAKTTKLRTLPAKKKEGPSTQNKKTTSLSSEKNSKPVPKKKTATEKMTTVTNSNERISENSVYDFSSRNRSKK